MSTTSSDPAVAMASPLADLLAVPGPRLEEIRMVAEHRDGP